VEPFLEQTAHDSELNHSSHAQAMYLKMQAEYEARVSIQVDAGTDTK
jgi:hypothetical protein